MSGPQVCANHPFSIPNRKRVEGLDYRRLNQLGAMADYQLLDVSVNLFLKQIILGNVSKNTSPRFEGLQNRYLAVFAILWPGLWLTLMYRREVQRLAEKR